MSGAAAIDAPALRIADLRKSFAARNGRRNEALRGVSLVVRSGEIVGLVGPDGAGKTTLLRCAAGLLVPDAGRSSLLGLDPVRDTIALRSRVGCMPQKFGLYQDLTVGENLDLHADLQGVRRDERPARYAELLEMTGLAPFTTRLAGRLSGGMKQKLGLACALVRRPELLLLDEPTVGVDPVSRRDLWAIVERLVRTEGLGVLLATAYLDEAATCARVVVLFDGAVAIEGAPAALAAAQRGRVLEASCPDERAARRLQVRLRAQPGVADATIVSGRVRVVLERADALSAALVAEVGLEPATPRFEDAFMALAAARRPAPAVVPVDRTARDDAPSPKEAPAPSAADPTAAPVVVRVRDLVKRFGEFVAVRDVSFDVHRGEIFGLLGPNGAGKTTTFRMLCGLLPATAGRLEVAGHDVRRSAPRARARLGYMAQQFSLYGQLGVEANLRFFGKAYGLGGARLRERLDWAYAEFDLGARRDQAAGSLPGGFKQRLAMAVALLHEPEILFLDEPTSGVDPLGRREFWARINAVAETGVTVVVTTHFMEEAEHCDRMLIQSAGAPLALGRPADVRALARTAANPEPTIEDAFIALALGRADPRGTPVDPNPSSASATAAPGGAA